MRRKILNAINTYERINHLLKKGDFDTANERMSKLNKELEEINNQSICSCAISIEQKFEQLRMLKDLHQRIENTLSPDDAIVESPDTLVSRRSFGGMCLLEGYIWEEIRWIESGLTTKEKKDIAKRLEHKEINFIVNEFVESNPIHYELAKCISKHYAEMLINKCRNEKDTRIFIKAHKENIAIDIDSYKGNKDLKIRQKRRGFYDILNKLELYSKTEESLYKDLQ